MAAIPEKTNVEKAHAFLEKYIADLLQKNIIPGASAQHSLNIHETYLKKSWSTTDALHEITANWFDQNTSLTRALVKEAGIEGEQRIRSRSAIPLIIESHFIFDDKKELLLGTITVSKDGITFRNRYSAILSSALEIGGTSKINRHRLIGKHGEGFKIAINLLLAHGFAVQYQTHGEDWIFKHDQNCLCVTRTKTAAQNVDTFVTVTGPNVLSLWVPFRFLCLTDWYHGHNTPREHMFSLGAEKTSIEIILHPSYQGCIMINGVVVERYAISYTGPYGYNIKGRLVINRDRTHPTTKQLADGFLEVLTQLAKTGLPKENIQKTFDMLGSGTIFLDMIEQEKKVKDSKVVKFFVDWVKSQNWYPCQYKNGADKMREWFKVETKIVSHTHAALLISSGGFLAPDEEVKRRFETFPAVPEPEVAGIRKQSEAAACVVGNLQPVATAWIKFVRADSTIPALWSTTGGKTQVYINLTVIDGFKSLDKLRLIIRALKWSTPAQHDFQTSENKRVMLRSIRETGIVKRPIEVDAPQSAAKRQQIIIPDDGSFSGEEKCKKCPVHCD